MSIVELSTNTNTHAIGDCNKGEVMHPSLADPFPRV